MGAVPSTSRHTSTTTETAEYLIGTFVGEKSLPLASDFWQKLLELPLTLRCPPHRVQQACELFENFHRLLAAHEARKYLSRKNLVVSMHMLVDLKDK